MVGSDQQAKALLGILKSLDRRAGDSVGTSEGKGRSKLVASIEVVVAAIAAAAIANPGLVSFG
jgi:hypothetical protein